MGTAATSTSLLRESTDPFWERLRELLKERGLDPDRAVLADLFPDDTDMEFGVVVDQTGRVYEFDLRYGPGDLQRQAREAFISDWRDMTEGWRDEPSRTQVEEAIEILNASRRDDSE